ncbi:MFS family permease [Microbacterium phyllosphaerae]|uniref:MFS family permease n=1 Tax=Microbacterium phyllosphaerae TaxID=124798 RepID=A0ABS4WL94_9MICO|nr:MFS transporter [Microbacterium phyllosphaerae]MBP2376985.1 MFS family permease [Microbacterium phyllosphaerae]
MTQRTAEQERLAALGSPQKLKTAIAAGTGAMIENYDFLAFGTASALYFGAAFFPSSDPVMGTLLAFLTFGVGFLARPLGGAVGGYLGDKYGRKPVLVTSLLVMGSATFVIGLLPTYAQIGFVAPIILVIVRLIQGLAYGAEWGGAVMMTFEHAPWRSRGKYSAIPQAGSPAGIALATVVFLASSQIGNDWAWRIPFLASAVLIAVGLFVRLKLEESPDFEQAKQSGEILKNPLSQVVRTNWRVIIQIISLRIVESCAYYIVATFLLSNINANHPEAKQTTLIALLVACIIAIPAVITSGWISDRIGRKRMYLIATIAVIAFGFPMFLLTNGGDPALIVLTYVIGISLIWASLAGVQGAWFGELFPTNTRNSGVSLGYQLASSISGFAPFIAGSLAATFGWVGGSLFYMLIGVIGLCGLLVTRETWGKAERDRVNAILEPRAATEERDRVR